ncbi:MAG: histidine--tRNA ligase, partial [Micrococcales bacterium]|nr:histidine--tRNA ligase [Micrococcales bacterium]
MAPKAISGFPEWLPTGYLVERHVVETLRQEFELHSYQEIQTRAVEPLGELLRKGETSKEVYVLGRLQDMMAASADTANQPDQIDESALALHFDLTVPLARYVLQHQNDLAFPFKRYQIQPVWRGERPQTGRFRQFTQADIDVIGRDHLPAHFETELPLVIARALRRLGLSIRVQVNNRQICQGFYTGIGLDQVDAVLREVDKLEKTGPAAVQAALVANGASQAQAAACLDLAAISADAGPDLEAAVTDLAGRVGVSGKAAAVLEAGLADLVTLLDQANTAFPGTFTAELKIARGLDYYTGAVYETIWLGHEDLGSICSGGRYDSLAKDNRATYPGIGLSVGISRLVSRLISQNLMQPTRAVPAACLVAVTNETERPASDKAANQLRARGIATDVAP